MTPIISKILEMIEDKGYTVRYTAEMLRLPIEFVIYAYNKYQGA